MPNVVVYGPDAIHGSSFGSLHHCLPSPSQSLWHAAYLNGHILSQTNFPTYCGHKCTEIHEKPEESTAILCAPKGIHKIKNRWSSSEQLYSVLDWSNGLITLV